MANNKIIYFIGGVPTVGTEFAVELDGLGANSGLKTIFVAAGNATQNFHCEVGIDSDSTTQNLLNQLNGFNDDEHGGARFIIEEASGGGEIIATLATSTRDIIVIEDSAVDAGDTFSYALFNYANVVNDFDKINVRAPFLLYYNDTDLSSVDLTLRVFFDGGSSRELLRSTAINGEVTMDISQILRGYIDDVFDGSYTVHVQSCFISSIRYDATGTEIATDSKTYHVLEGFPYFELGANATMNDTVLMSNKTIIANDFSSINIPVQTVSQDVTLSYYYKNQLKHSETKSYTNRANTVVQYSTNSKGDVIEFKSRVLADGGVVEAEDCLRDAYDEFYGLLNIDKVIVSYGDSAEVIDVKEIEECKYNPYKVTFKNIYGVWQDLWFFKRSNLNMSTKSEGYNSKILSNGGYNTSRHQYKTFIKNGREKIVLNSGYYPEEYNEIFRQLQLSEQVYLTYNDQILPVNIKDGNFSYKNKLNDKLINYSVEFDFAFDKINTIR